MRLRCIWTIILAIAVAVIAGGCFGVDSQPSVARIVNDLDLSVRLRLCSTNDCQNGFYPPDQTLSPDDAWSVNVSSRGVPAVYLVETAAGSRYGCLPLVSPSKREQINVFVSENVACRRDLNEDTFWPQRWEEAK